MFSECFSIPLTERNKRYYKEIFVIIILAWLFPNVCLEVPEDRDIFRLRKFDMLVLKHFPRSTSRGTGDITNRFQRRKFGLLGPETCAWMYLFYWAVITPPPPPNIMCQEVNLVLRLILAENFVFSTNNAFQIVVPKGLQFYFCPSFTKT
jgi:hypothetical protein